MEEKPFEEEVKPVTRGRKEQDSEMTPKEQKEYKVKEGKEEETQAVISNIMNMMTCTLNQLYHHYHKTLFSSCILHYYNPCLLLVLPLVRALFIYIYTCT